MSVFRGNQHDSSIRDTLGHFQQLMPVKFLPFLWTPAKAVENRSQVWFPGVYLPGMNPIEVREVRVGAQPAQRKTCDWYFLCLSAILVCMIVLVTTVVITIILGNNNPDPRITTGPTRPFINPTTSASHKSTTSTRQLSTTNSSSGDTNANWTSTKVNNISSSLTAESLTTNNTLKSTPHSADSVTTSSVKTTALVTDGVKKSPNHKFIRTTTSRALILLN